MTPQNEEIKDTIKEFVDALYTAFPHYTQLLEIRMALELGVLKESEFDEIVVQFTALYKKHKKQFDAKDHDYFVKLDFTRILPPAIHEHIPFIDSILRELNPQEKDAVWEYIEALINISLWTSP